MVGVEEGHKFRYHGDLYFQESTFPLVELCVYQSENVVWLTQNITVLNFFRTYDKEI